MARALPDSSWVRGLLLQGSAMITIDTNTYKALTPNGDTWAPAGFVDVHGKGVGMCCRLDLDHANVDVFTVIQYPQLQPTGSTAHVKMGRLDAADVPFFVGGSGYTEWQYQAGPFSAIQQEQTLWAGGYGSGRDSYRTRRKLSRFAWKLRVHNGFTLQFGSVQFRVIEDRSAIGVPDSLPAVRVYRVDKKGKIEPLRAPDANTDSDGFFTLNPRPSTGNDYDQGGVAQSILYTTNQNNVVDSTAYEYYFEVREEGGANSWPEVGASASGNEWHAPLAICRGTRFEPA